MKLEIRRKTDLAIRLLGALGDRGSRVAGRELAEAVGTSTLFLAQVAAPLVRSGWVATQPGRSGGYELIAELADISALDVIEAVEGPTDTDACVLRSGNCNARQPCVTHDAWSRARMALLNELAATPLSVLSADGVKL